MKKLKVITVLFLITFTACSEDSTEVEEREENAAVLGSWKLTEQMADPGDGSGTFQPIKSEKILVFNSNGVVESKNGSLCSPYSDEMLGSGTFSSADSLIYTMCSNPNIAQISFRIEGEMLRLDYASNEGFSQKYSLVKQ